MTKIKFLLLAFACFALFLSSVTDAPKRQMEKLDRGIVAVRTSPDSVFISWRLLGTDPEGIGFNLYRGSQRLNKKPLAGATNFIDNTAADEVYSVRAVIKKKRAEGIEYLQCLGKELCQNTA